MLHRIPGIAVFLALAVLSFGVGLAQSADKAFSFRPTDLKINATVIIGNDCDEGDKTPVNSKLAVIPAKNIDLIKRSVGRLLELQEDDGAWPYEGVYRVGGKIPVGYRVGGTSIACQALLSAPIGDRASIHDAVIRGIELVLSELDDPRMKVSKRDTYDVRVWGHIYALDLFCQLETEKGFVDIRKRTQPWIQKLIDIVVQEQLKDGGWNYASRRRHACFVTAPAAQALLRARSLGHSVDDEVFVRTANVLLASRNETGAFQYSGPKTNRQRADLLPGSIARGAISETTLLLLGHGSVKNVRASIDAFHEHWLELEKRRQKTGTHRPPYGVAPYYFYYGHRYLAQAIQMLPPEQRSSEFERFETVLFKTKEDDDTWNDRIFERSKAFGTSMSLLALSRDHAKLPVGIKKEQKETVDSDTHD